MSRTAWGVDEISGRGAGTGTGTGTGTGAGAGAGAEVVTTERRRWCGGTYTEPDEDGRGMSFIAVNGGGVRFYQGL